MNELHDGAAAPPLSPAAQAWVDKFGPKFDALDDPQQQADILLILRAAALLPKREYEELKDDTPALLDRIVRTAVALAGYEAYAARNGGAA